MPTTWLTGTDGLHAVSVDSYALLVLNDLFYPVVDVFGFLPIKQIIPSCW